ncbi:hypothetical protein [Paenibacillus alginolyticus]|uniref:Uncharacterized protein n=1 Tax=Paenibacillus alginolyticus TaxID=59839 RepID=A0ABT4GF10_9BACL|nr:hypothetical protein [Paenibacillus alginolyticus]MCY9694772.1 hypothetical protein [Paenibacillus alginolyticus]MEC0147056.1 hypothetical protein [Paenibacillus alginolyticus]
MNIYGHIKVAIQILDSMLSKNKCDVSKNRIVEGLRDTWGLLHKYCKNIHPDRTNEINDRLNNLEPEDFLITKDMLRDATTVLNRIKDERINVKEFMYSYFRILDVLLIFHKPYEDGCNLCQSDLFYYFDTLEKVIIRECETCGTQFNIGSEERLTSRTYSNLRPATRKEIIMHVSNFEEVSDII